MNLRRLVPLTAAAALVLAAPAAASPVKCKGGDVTPDDRVFSEPQVSTGFLRFDEFECGMNLLERRYPDKLEITTFGTSAGGHPLYDILMTNEKGGSRKKEKLLVMSSIHGNEPGGKEGAARVIEDMLDPRFVANEPWVPKVLDEFVIHFVFPNPDGWIAGDLTGSGGAGVLMTRGNDHGTDLNRQLPVKGWINSGNRPLAEPEGQAALRELFDEGGWDLGTDNHGQLHDTYGAAGLQIVGQFDFDKSERLARFADGITEGMRRAGVLDALQTLNEETGQDLGSYHWGTLYDMLGYSASGSWIDYYNTADGVNGVGFATELTLSNQSLNHLTFSQALNQVWVDSVRGINFTMFQQAIDKQDYTFPVGSRAGYVFDPERIRHDDENGNGFDDGADQVPYDVSRMKFFEDLNDDASRKLKKVRVGEVLSGEFDLDSLDSLVLANDPMPEGHNAHGWFAVLKEWVEKGGNLIVTDAAFDALPKVAGLPESSISTANHYVGFVDFPASRTDPLLQGLRGVASQTYDTVPIGYRFGGANSAPNWKVSSAAFTAAGGKSLGTNGSGQTIYGELPVGAGKVRVLGALLPDPTEEFYHPYGLQNYAVTYTGYTLLENMLKYDRPGSAAAKRARAKAKRARAAKLRRAKARRAALAARGR